MALLANQSVQKKTKKNEFWCIYKSPGKNNRASAKKFSQLVQSDILRYEHFEWIWFFLNLYLTVLFVICWYFMIISCALNVKLQLI